MHDNLKKQFARIGAEVRFEIRSALSSPFEIDVVQEKGYELFSFKLRHRDAAFLDLTVLEIKERSRHLVLLARLADDDGETLTKEHFLLGYDERHLFVASIDPASTVDGARQSLKPPEISLRESGLNSNKRHRRKTQLFKRQGEWFFLPAEIEPEPLLVLRKEPLVRGGGGKPHIADFAYRYGGVAVRVCSRYPWGLTLEQYAAHVKNQPSLATKYDWQDRRRNAAVFVKGKIRHPDHATISLPSWHRVLMNRERGSEKVVFLD